MDEDTLAEIAEQLRHRVRDVIDPDENARWLLERAPNPNDWFRLVFVQAMATPTTDWLKLTRWTRPAPDSSIVDEVAVERACEGEDVSLTLAERRVAIARLLGKGLSARTIAARLGLDERTVQRHQERRRTAA